MQTKQVELNDMVQTSQFELVELEYEDLLLVSGGVTLTYTGNAALATGVGGNATLNAAGDPIATPGIGGFAFTARGPGILTF